MRKKIMFLSVLFLALSGWSQDKKSQDIQAIKSLCGCFEIDFDYTETFSPDTNYVFHDDYHAHAAAEYAFIVEESSDKIVIQHLLVLGNGMIIKHWREDWLYENTEFYQFDHDLKWTYSSLPKDQVKGTWTQKVYQVDDSPRYEGMATWIHADGKHFWENRSDSPLPRREYSHRSDYNVLSRGNRIELTDYGWIHEQDNIKILRSDDKDVILAEEKGYNRYMNQDVSKCQAAIDWWSKHGDYWAIVRNEWADLFQTKKDIQIAKKKDDKMLWEVIFNLGDESVDRLPKEKKQVKKELVALIEKFTA
jgi:hypothetical protein